MKLNYRANLTAAEFPFLSEQWGRTVIIPQYDQNYARFSNSPKNSDQDIGTPQVYYCHNVFPTDAGMCSVKYSNIVLPPTDSDFTFSEVFALRDSNDNKAYLAVTASGRCYIQLVGFSTWTRTTDKLLSTTTGIITTAYVNGVTYIYYGNTGCVKYNWTTNTLDPVTLTSLVPANIIGICAASGYMIAWTKTAVAWSSTIDPTDFTPSLITGAGAGNVREIKGNITCCLPCTGGFVTYTKENAVTSLYTGNAQFPFAFDDCKGSGGLASPSYAAYDGNSLGQYAYTTAGLQKIQGKQASIEFPNVTDFLSGQVFDDFNETLQKLITTTIINPMVKKIVLVSNRYLVISYGITSLTHALVYDIGQERWGKLKIDHVDCFEYIAPDPNVVETPRRSVGFLKLDGSVQVVNFSYNTSDSNGVLILGKYQVERNAYTTMLEIHLENIKVGTSFSLGLFTSLDGKNTAISTPVLKYTNGLYRRYDTRKSGINHSLVFTGAFHACSLELKLLANGKVR